MTTQVLESIFPSDVLGGIIEVRWPIGLSKEALKKSRLIRTHMLSDALPLKGLPTGVMIQVDIGGHPPFPNGSKHFFGHFGNLLFLAGFHFRGHFEGLNEVFSR
jgi:hypothetical protein